MKRNMDLYRAILSRAEEAAPTDHVGANEVDGYSDAVVYAHIRLLADEGLVEIVDFSSGDHPNACRISRITASGHDFLAETRDDNRWNRLKKKAQELGPLTLNTIQTAMQFM